MALLLGAIEFRSVSPVITDDAEIVPPFDTVTVPGHVDSIPKIPFPVPEPTLIDIVPCPACKALQEVGSSIVNGAYGAPPDGRPPLSEVHSLGVAVNEKL